MTNVVKVTSFQETQYDQSSDAGTEARGNSGGPACGERPDEREQRDLDAQDRSSNPSDEPVGPPASDLTVLTPTIPGREELLVECKASVSAQTVPAFEHIVDLDEELLGLARGRNELVKKCKTSWALFLDDDDIIYENYVERVLPYLEGADVVYTWCDKNFDYPTDLPFDGEALRQRNVIPATACIRLELLREVGGYPTDVAHEDWGLWLRMLDAGAKFVCVPEWLWSYRRLEDGLHSRITAQVARGEIRPI